jgi:hypothetical protein
MRTPNERRHGICDGIAASRQRRCGVFLRHVSQRLVVSNLGVVQPLALLMIDRASDAATAAGPNGLAAILSRSIVSCTLLYHCAVAAVAVVTQDVEACGCAAWSRTADTSMPNSHAARKIFLASSILGIIKKHRGLQHNDSPTTASSSEAVGW